ncbi:MAG: CbiX/SirB N-terminal domain-containing protein [Mycobacterium sp.]|uniref:sirohydrochlorin chelatase n=1 Tax=Mycobacterium sp. TaxID=1785 RepID=UPI003CC595DF
MRAARLVTTLVVTAHGSADPRSAANARVVAELIADMRPNLTIRVAFCELNEPRVADVLAISRGKVVVTPLLLADAYHSRVDIPKQIADAGEGRRALLADVLGEDDRLISLLRRRLAESGVSVDRDLGVVVAAIGSSAAAANTRTQTVATKLAVGSELASATTIFATGSGPSLADAADLLRRRGARRLVIAPWFLAPGRLPDKVATAAKDAGIPMAAPLGAHRLVAATVLSRFDEAVAAGQLAA